MAKRKAKNRVKARSKPVARQPRKTSKGLLHFRVPRFAWRIILVAVIVGVLYWQWSNLTSWAANIIYQTMGLFGWGLLLLIIVALSALGGILWRQRQSSLLSRFRQWLGVIAFTMATWGILGFANLGGRIGLGIIGYPDFIIGVFRIAGLIFVGVILVAPGACWRAAKKATALVRQQLERRPAPRPAIPQEPPPPIAITPPPRQIEAERQPVTPVPQKTEAERQPITTPPAPAPAQRELRQVAEEVWKKYGQSPDLVIVDGWRLPPIDILDRSPEVEFSQADNVQRAKLIEDSLASYGVEAKVVQINAGPTVTQFGVEPGWDRKMREVRERDRDGNIRVRLEEVSRTRVKVDRITSLANDLALALAAPSIRIEAPVPGKSVVGIEVPNKISSLVSLRGVIETSAFQKIETKSKLAIALGKGAGGEAIAADLDRMPHLLIAGATGSGKTVCLNSIICCLLLHNPPTDARFIMIDPKRVELTPFNSIPHLATPVIVDTNKALPTLRWLNHEMDNRYQKLATAGVRNIEGYNKNKQGDEKLPYLVLIIDELADLMATGFDEVEHILCRLAQLARATGIHLVVATQRPSVDVVTGLIKANFPTRISFAVTSQVDSRTILDIGGAEKLLGAGDMLYMPTEAAKPKRLQGSYVSDAETERLVYFWGSQRREEAAPLKIEEVVTSLTAARVGYPEDPLLEAARQLAREHKHISTSYLQRKLRIGYPRAARIMEQLEEEGVKREEG
jgi:S-DNA-T family DNA segregation ATPase FtsK/SpoIIIE